MIVWSLLVMLALVACEGSPTATPSPTASDAVASDAGGEAGQGTTTTAERGPWRLVTLGDAYTAGYPLEQYRRDSWPAQLVESLKRGGMHLRPTNLAVRGYSSWQVLEEQLSQVATYQPDVVTVQVGINDLVYGETEEGYRENVGRILDGLLELLPPEQIFAITTPGDALDAAGPNTDELRAAVARLNASLMDVAAERDVEVIDIGVVNALGDGDGSLVEKDGIYLYPTAKQYAGWAELIGPHVYAALQAIEP